MSSDLFLCKWLNPLRSCRLLLSLVAFLRMDSLGNSWTMFWDDEADEPMAPIDPLQN